MPNWFYVIIIIGNLQSTFWDLTQSALQLEKQTDNAQIPIIIQMNGI